MFFACSGSGEITSSQSIYVNGSWLTSLLVYTNGTNDATVTLYNNTAASGTVVGKFKVTGSENYGGRIWQFPRKCENGIYASISGTGASCIVEYIPYV